MKICRHIAWTVLICLFLRGAWAGAAEGGFVVKGAVLSGYRGSASVATVPENVSVIGKKAFAGNKKIKKVMLPEGVTTIKSAAFQGCAGLKTVRLPSSVKKIAGNAFDGCKKMTVIAPKGSYALKFAKKYKIPWKKTEKETGKEEGGLYNITGITCYWYTAGTHPCTAEKKTVAEPADFDRIYEALRLLDSKEPAREEDQVAGGKTLRVIVSFSDKESVTIECNDGVFMENETVNKLSANASAAAFWDSIKSDISEETL